MHTCSIGTRALLNAAGVGGDTRPEIGAFLGDGTGDSRTFHLSLIIDYHPRIVLKVQEHPVFPANDFPLPNHDRRHYFFPQLGLSLLDGAHNHVTAASGRQTIQSTLDAMHRDDVQVLSASVICTIDDSSYGQTEGDPELSTG